MRQDVINVIQGEAENQRRAAAQDVIDKAYQTAPVGFKIMEDADGNRAKVFDDGRIEEIN